MVLGTSNLERSPAEPFGSRLHDGRLLPSIAKFPDQIPLRMAERPLEYADSEIRFFSQTCRKGPTMEKGMCIGSIAIAAILVLLFIADFIIGFPFGHGTAGYDSPYLLVDLGGLFAAGILGYLAWNAYRDVK